MGKLTIQPIVCGSQDTLNWSVKLPPVMFPEKQTFVYQLSQNPEQLFHLDGVSKLLTIRQKRRQALV